METLQKVARDSLVIMVSHDEQLTKKYADQIIYMKDGSVEKIEYANHNHHVDILPLIHLKPRENKPALPFSFCFSHTLNSVKRRKWRTVLITLTTSLGLIGVGLGTVLSKIISTNLYKSYSSIIDTNKVVMRAKDKPSATSNLIHAMEYEDVDYLYNQYKGNISNIGIYYWNNMDTIFTYNNLSLSYGSIKKTLPEYTLKNFNEFEYVSNCKTTIYPAQLSNIQKDEVILGLTYPLLNEICYQLYIQRNVNSLSTFLRSNELYIDVDVENYNWSYANSFQIKVVGFTMVNKNCFFHSDSTWNEHIFERRCGLSNTNIINSTSKNPWDLKKCYLFEFVRNRDYFLEDMRFKKEYRFVAAEILDKSYYPNLCFDLETEQCNRVALLTVDGKGKIDGYLSEFFKKSSKHIHSCLYGSSSAYAIYPESLMMGFARMTYLSNDINSIEEVIDLTAYIRYEDSGNVNVDDKVIEGHFTKNNKNGLTFNPHYSLLSGKEPEHYNEIVISQQIATKFHINAQNINIIYLSFPIKEELLPNGYLSRDYRIIGLKVVGISDSNKNEISHKEAWSTMFFQCMVGISRFDLDIDSVALEIDEDSENEVMAILNKAFPKYNVSSPMSSVKESVNTICRYIELILLVLSISSVIIASLLLSICNYLHFIEVKKDIGLVRCVGVSKKEASKLIFVHSFFMSFMAFMVASIQLVVICIFLSQSLSNYFYIESTFIFNPLSILYMFLLATLISLFSSLTIRRSVNKLNPLDCLR